MNKKLLLPVAFAATVLATSCSNEQQAQEIQALRDSLNAANAKIEELKAPINVQSDVFYPVEDGKSLVVANPIIYNVAIKNYNPYDEWSVECLKNTNSTAIANTIFQGVYKGKLKPIDFFSEDQKELSIADVKKLEKQFSRKQIGQIQFEEYWYYDEAKQSFYKDVKSVVLGYELYNAEGEVRGFQPAFKVNLTMQKPDTK